MELCLVEVGVQAHVCPDAGTCPQALGAWGPRDVGCALQGELQLPVTPELVACSHTACGLPRPRQTFVPGPGTLVTEPILPPPCSKPNLLDIGVCEEKNSIYLQGDARRMDRPKLKDPTLTGFSGKRF